MRNVILDFDGTIGDTQSLIVKTLQDTMQRLHLEIKPRGECAKTIGLRLDEAFMMLYSMPQDKANLCAKTYRDIFEENKLHIVVEPFPHVIETIRQLHRDGFVLAVASSRGRGSLLGYLEQLQIEDCISCVVAAEDVKQVKPAPDMVLKVLEEIGGKAEDTLVVGDMVYDIEMGRNAGTHTCGVTYGNGTRKQLAAAEYVIDDFSELLSICK